MQIDKERVKRASEFLSVSLTEIRICTNKDRLRGLEEKLHAFILVFLMS